MNDHPDLMTLVHLARGDLGRIQEMRVIHHCKRCDSCGDQLAALLALRGGLPKRPVFSTGQFAAAAALIVAAATLGILFRPEAPPRVPENALAGPSDVEHSSDLAHLATRESLLLSRVDFVHPVGVSNAADESEVSRPESIRSALTALTEHRIETAIAEFDQHLSQFPGDLDAIVYLGVALYLDESRPERVESLLLEGWERGGNTDLPEIAAWYLANHYLRNGDVSRAAEWLENAATQYGILASKARALQRSLPRP